MGETIEAPVDRQLAAYNDHDVDAFVEPYGEDIRICNFPDEILCEGKSRLREMYEGIFARAPAIHARLVNRILIQNKVIDEEYVTHRAGKPDMRAVAIYEVEDKLIRKVFFLKEG